MINLKWQDVLVAIMKITRLNLKSTNDQSLNNWNTIWKVKLERKHDEEERKKGCLAGKRHVVQVCKIFVYFCKSRCLVEYEMAFLWFAFASFDFLLTVLKCPLWASFVCVFVCRPVIFIPGSFRHKLWSCSKRKAKWSCRRKKSKKEQIAICRQTDRVAFAPRFGQGKKLKRERERERESA